MDSFDDDRLAVSDARASPDLSLDGDDGDDGLQIGGSAPKRFKSCFIFFSMEKHKEIKAELRARGFPPKSANITKLVSEAWRNLSDENKKRYQDMAVLDKLRYVEETASYNSVGRRPKKKPRDPNAPKRPMSAFLAFANIRRAEVKADNPKCSNGEISRLLGCKWRELPETIRQKYRDAESASWMSYKEQMTDFRKKTDGRKKLNKGLDATCQPRKKQKSRPFDEDSLCGSSFDDPNFNVLGSLEPTNTTNHDDIMAASAALRGVRAAGPNNTFHFGGSGTHGGAFGVGGGNLMGLGLDFGGLQTFQHGGKNTSPLLSSNMSSHGGGTHNSGGNSMNNGVGIFGCGAFGQDNNSHTGAMLERGLPIHQYASYNGVVSGAGSVQTNMLMQAAFQGSSVGGFRGIRNVGQHEQLSAQVEPHAFGPTGVGGILHPHDTPLLNMESLGGMGGSLGSNNSNHDNRVSTVNSGFMHGFMNDGSHSRFDGMGRLQFH